MKNRSQPIPHLILGRLQFLFELVVLLEREPEPLAHLLVERLVVLEERLERLQHLDLRGDARLRGGLPLDHRHPEGALVARDEALEVLEEEARVVALRLQLADLLVLVQHLLARRVQLLRDGRELLQRGERGGRVSGYLGSKLNIETRVLMGD